MTREEAIRIIETVFQDEYVYKYYDSITHQALNMAIEALSKPNYETDTEVRLAVTNRKKEKVILWDAFGEVEYYPIEALSAERVGEWIYRGTFKFSNHYPKHRYECSECHQIVHLPLTEEAYRYCPNCGARMESKK